MKLIAYLIMTACLCFGTLAATVAYSPKLSLSDEELTGLTLNATAGTATFGENAGAIASAQARPSITPLVISTTLKSPTHLFSQDGLSQEEDRSLSFVSREIAVAIAGATGFDANGGSADGFSHFLVADGLLTREIEPIRLEYEKTRFVKYVESDDDAVAALKAWSEAHTEFKSDPDAAGQPPARPAVPGFDQDEKFASHWKEWLKDAVKSHDAAKAAEESESAEDAPEEEPAISPSYPPTIAWLDGAVVLGVVESEGSPHFETVLADALGAQSFLSVLMLSDADLGSLAFASSFEQEHIKDVIVDGTELLIGEQQEHKVVPLLLANTVITANELGTLRNRDAGRIRVKEFSVGRWDVAWMMGASCLGLGIAAFMVKTATRKEIEAELAQPSSHENSPGNSMERVVAVVNELVSTMSSAGEDAEKNAIIIDRVGELQRNELATLADSRTTLVAQLTLTGYAQFMDRFSAMERRLNRAWSAAADGVTEEAIISLNGANELLPEVVSAMKGDRS